VTTRDAQKHFHIEDAESAEKQRFIAVAALPGCGAGSLLTPEIAKLAKNKQ
jgi:hypothetical protein